MTSFRRQGQGPYQVSDQLRGMLLVALAAFGFSSMHAMIRLLSASLHPFEVAFFRNFFGLLILTPVLLRRGLAPLRTKRLPLHALRSVLQMGSMLLFFTALSLTPIARISAMSFTAPLFATVGAVLFLREAIHARRVAALLVGFAGAMIVMRPGAEMDTGLVLVLLSSAGWAVALLVIKSLSSSDSSLTLALWMGLFMAPLSLFPAALVWTWPDAGDYLLLVVMGATGTASHLCMAEAFRKADASAVLPVDFTRLVWASLLGLVIFGEVPELPTLIGGTVIFTSTAYIAYREARISARASAAPKQQNS